MPRRPDLDSILILGSGPIVIGQACEFDYAGTQAVKALREEGVRVVLLNSNPATIMTDPGIAHATYVEPMTVEAIDEILARERVVALLPTLGGQTALNLGLAAARAGVLAKHGVELLGATERTIEMAEDRAEFKAAMARIGLACPRSEQVTSVEAAREVAARLGFPIVLRPSFTLGGTGGGIARDAAELDRKVAYALDASPVRSVLVEESVIGWKEFELEVVRDAADNCVIVCSIENVDPMGVHTGDSITVAPAMTLTDKEYQRLRDAAFAIVREIGVTCGGSNVQFAVDPRTGRMLVIEMNPRVSRSSALASKATGFPIAKVAARLALGYTLDELKNDITQVTPASFEPTIDYVVVKWPRFAFEKFPGAKTELGPQMRSVGEAMAIGRTFKEAFGKALRSLEIGRWGFDLPLGAADDAVSLERAIATPSADRMLQLGRAFQLGLTVERAHAITAIDRWFLREVHAVAQAELEVARAALGELAGEYSIGEHGVGKLAARLRADKRAGMSDRRIAALAGVTEAEVRSARWAHGIHPVWKRVDTCGGELACHTAYMYSTYEDDCEAAPSARDKVIVLGGGPNRIGQGIEFDYCCVHAALALRGEGVESIMVNCNPETVSTDYDTSDRLYFEPLALEDVLEICRMEKPRGVIVQLGGQTPLGLATSLAREGVAILGTPADAIDRAEDRKRFGELIDKLGLRAPPWGTANTLDEARAIAARLGFPVIVRPSYVLGGRAMQRIDGEGELERYFQALVKASGKLGESSVIGLPLLVDRFLAGAIELDVDVLADGRDAIVAGVMEHVEEAGIHSGDSACALPPYSVGPEVVAEIERWARALALELGVVGLMNVQVVLDHQQLYVLEVNPRASRTVPFVAKATGLPLAALAARVMLGRTLRELGLADWSWRPPHVAVKEVVLPFAKFDADPLLGPEMRSTGEAIAIDDDFPRAFAKSQLAVGNELPDAGIVMADTADHRFAALGFDVTAPDVAAVLARKVAMVIAVDPKSSELRRAALRSGTPLLTTIRAASAAADAIAATRTRPTTMRALQSVQSVKVRP